MRGAHELFKAPEHDGDRSFKLLQNRLDRETDLLVHRTGWVMASQTFLFSGYAVALNGYDPVTKPEFAQQSRHLITMIPWLGVMALVLLGITIGAGAVALAELRRKVVPQEDPHAHIFDLGRAIRFAGLAAPLLIPAIFLAAWVTLLLPKYR